MVKCPHAAQHYLTIVYRITEPRQPRALLEQSEWSAASHTHAIQERDRLIAALNDIQSQHREAFRKIERLHEELAQACEQRDELLAALCNALPYVEDVLANKEQLACFKPGEVQGHAVAIRAAIANATQEAS